MDPVGDEADLRDALACAQGTFREFYGDFPLPGRQRIRFWSSDEYQQTTITYGAYAAEGGPVLGVASVTMALDHNLHLLETVLLVPAGTDGDEAGAATVRALLDRAIELARERGRRTVSVLVSEDLPDARYAPARAGKPVFTNLRSVLDLTSVDRERFAAWAAPSPANERYELVRWGDRCPDDLAGAYLAAAAAMDDAPLEEAEYEFSPRSVERMRAREENSAALGVRRHVTAAVTADGEIGGYTMFVAYPEEPGGLDIWDTGVARSHRGRGLGRRLKADATLWLLREYPDAKYVHTYNNHSNNHMIAINTELGYRPADREAVYEFPV